MALVDSTASFEKRCKELREGIHDVFVGAGINNFSSLAFVVGTSQSWHQVVMADLVNLRLTQSNTNRQPRAPVAPSSGVDIPSYVRPWWGSYDSGCRQSNHHKSTVKLCTNVRPSLLRLAIPTCYTIGTRSVWPIVTCAKAPSSSELTEHKVPTTLKDYVALEGYELAEWMGFWNVRTHLFNDQVKSDSSGPPSFAIEAINLGVFRAKQMIHGQLILLVKWSIFHVTQGSMRDWSPVQGSQHERPAQLAPEYTSNRVVAAVAHLVTGKRFLDG